MTGSTSTLSEDTIEKFHEDIANYIQFLIDNIKSYEIEDDELLDLIRDDV